MITIAMDVLRKSAALVCGLSLVMMAAGCSRNESPAPTSTATATPAATPTAGNTAKAPEAGMSREERIALHQAKIDKIVEENRRKHQNLANQAAGPQDASGTTASQTVPK